MKRRIVVMMIALFTTILFSQTTGKIKGVVLDENGEPLPGANIVVEGTTWGAESDEDGYYYIIGVRAGTYSLKAQFIGYAPKEAKEVKVRVGLTTTQNFKMSSEVIELEAIGVEVVMEKKVEKDVTTSVRTVDMGNIEQMAVTQVEDVLKGTAGIKTDADGELHFRGGRAGEVNYVIDGISVGDPTGAKSNPVEINFANVETFNIQKGIPDAEYGDALSGSVNIVMKIGDQEKTSGHVKYSTDSFMGDSKLDYNRGEFSLSGPIPLPMSGMKPTYYVATDFTVQNGFGRSYRELGSKDGEYFEFKDYDLTGFGFEVPQKRENNFNIILKGAYDLSETMKLSASYTKSKLHNYNYDYLYRYTPETVTQETADITVFNLNWRHTLNQQSFYDLIFSYYNREYESLPGGKKPDEFVFQDELDFFSVQINDIIANGVRDGGSAEGYLDLNANGYFDREYYVETAAVNTANYGNYTAGEDTWIAFNPTYDANMDGYYEGDFLYDSNSNNAWDHWERGTSYTGFSGDCLTTEIVEGYIDSNLNGKYDQNVYDVSGDEPYTDGDRFNDTGEPYVDQKRFYMINGVLMQYANGYWDEGQTVTLNISGTDYDYSSQLTEAFWDRIDFIKSNQYYQATVTMTADTSAVTIIYPKEHFEDLKTSLGSAEQPTPRYNDVYNSAYDRVFDEFEAFSSLRHFGSSTDDSILGWTDGHSPEDNPSDYVEFIGSYSVYKAPAAMYANVPNVNLITFDTAYSTWLDNNKNGTYDAPGDTDGDGNRYDSDEDFVDYNYNGTWNKSTGFLQPGTYLDESQYRLFDNAVTKLKGSYTNQLNRFHMLKTGFEFTMNDLDYYKVMNPWFYYDIEQYEVSEGDLYPDRGEEKTVYKYEPKEFSAYAQDKMEFEDLVVNAGIRLDMRILDDKSVDYYEEKYDAGEFGYEEAINKYTYAVSPRFGISHSISETSKLFFSYGHLYQLPNYTQVYDPNTKAGRNPLFGNMNLDYERNVQYELGVVNEVGEYLIDVTGYFKDIYDMINTKTYEYGITNASVYYNSDYGKSRGVEISVDKSLSSHYLWGLSYTLSYAYGKSSSATSNFDDNDKLVVKEYPLDWDERHTLNTYLTFVWGKGETLFDLPYTDDWSMSFTTDFGSGKPFTPSKDYYDRKVAAEDIENNSERLPWTSNTDLKLSKNFSFTGENKVDYGRLKFEFNVYNLFNKINTMAVYSDTGTWNTRSKYYYEDAPQNSNWAEVFANPSNIAEKRNYRFGVSYMW